jgi:hypothetical protein
VGQFFPNVAIVEKKMWRGPELRTRFESLDALLTRYEFIWKVQPFTTLQNPWLKEAPEMADWLDGLSFEQAQQLERDDESRQQVLRRFIPELDEMLELCKAEPLPDFEMEIPQEWLMNIKGRKIEQITAFASRLRPSEFPYLEWCSGKGHLARLLAHAHQQTAHCLEINRSLLEHGRELAREQGVDVHFAEGDALDESSLELLQPERHAIALHACGVLHRRLIQAGASLQTRRLSVAPCCYAREPYLEYQPFSEAGRNARLKLSKDNIRLATQETVVASPRITQLRLKNNGWRLAFDCLLRDLTGKDEYTKMHSLSKKYLHGDFETWAHTLAEREGIELPEGIDYAAYETLGRQRQEYCSPLELPRFPFRRPLEVWLLLDRALFLQEKGYDVTLGLFCEKKSSPRNFLIQAER